MFQCFNKFEHQWINRVCHNMILFSISVQEGRLHLFSKYILSIYKDINKFNASLWESGVRSHQVTWRVHKTLNFTLNEPTCICSVFIGICFMYPMKRKFISWLCPRIRFQSETKYGHVWPCLSVDSAWNTLSERGHAYQLTPPRIPFQCWSLARWPGTMTQAKWMIKSAG